MTDFEQCLLLKSNDGGDACNRTCAAALAAIYAGARPGVGFLKTLRNPKRPWIWRRSPEAGKWYAEWDRFSRDQSIPLIILFGEMRMYRELAWFIAGHLFFRLMFFAQNTRRNFVYKNSNEHKLKSTPDVRWRPGWKIPDLTGPEFWALEIRAMPAPLRWLMWPLLCVFDLETLAGSLIRRYLRPQSRDVINHTLVLVNGRRRSPTPVMWLARKVTPSWFLQERLDSWFSEPGEPPLHDLLRGRI